MLSATKPGNVLNIFSLIACNSVDTNVAPNANDVWWNTCKCDADFVGMHYWRYVVIVWVLVLVFVS